MLGLTELVLDVSARLPFDERVRLAASVYLPDLAAAAPRAVLVCWPGGSYARAYWDMQIAGYAGYSFAEHMTAHGFAVVAADHLGVGASSKPATGDQVDFETMSAAAATFVEQLRAMLAEGSPELGGTPPAKIPIIGVGHSLGACLTVVTQARHRCYDAVALLGFTHGHKAVSVTAVAAAEREPAEDAGILRQTAIEQAQAFFGETWDDVYGYAPREPNHSWLHRPDVPAAVIAAGAGREARLVTGEVDEQVRQLFRATHSAHRDMVLRGVEAGRHRCGHIRGPDDWFAGITVPPTCYWVDCERVGLTTTRI